MTDTITFQDDGYLPNELARNLMAWALTYMTQAELRGCSQQQLLDRYSEQHLRPTMEVVYPEIRAWSEAGSKALPPGDGEAGEAIAITTWPYSAGSRLLTRELAANIRAWALTVMSEPELRGYAQQQLLRMYLLCHSMPALQKVAPWIDREAIAAAAYGDDWQVEFPAACGPRAL
jgi:hypothetical protein